MSTYQNQIIKLFGKSKLPFGIDINNEGEPFFNSIDVIEIFKHIDHKTKVKYYGSKMISEEELFSLYEKIDDDGVFKCWFTANVLPDIRKCKRQPEQYIQTFRQQATNQIKQKQEVDTSSHATRPINMTYNIQYEKQIIDISCYEPKPLKLEFSQFMAGNYDDQKPGQQPFKLYIVRESLTVHYVGISNRNIWSRWFEGSRGHIQFNIYGEMLGNSTIGKLVLQNHKLFTIELWTIPDCLSFLGFTKYDKINCSIHDLEPRMIKKFKPTYNVIYNSQ